MQVGFILDHSHSMSFASSWVSGNPEPAGKLFGIIDVPGIKADDNRASAIPIHVFRCVKCGFLESYANAN
jgi:hypothetical protein